MVIDAWKIYQTHCYSEKYTLWQLNLVFVCSFNLSEHKQLKTTNQLYLICNFVTNKL